VNWVGYLGLFWGGVPDYEEFIPQVAQAACDTLTDAVNLWVTNLSGINPTRPLSTTPGVYELPLTSGETVLLNIPSMKYIDGAKDRFIPYSKMDVLIKYTIQPAPGSTPTPSPSPSAS
jgi:hypothetical protein